MEKQERKNRVFNKSNFLRLGALLSILFFIGIIISTRTHVDKVIISPGTAETINDKVDFGDTQTFDSEGDIRFLTVLVSQGRPTVVEYWFAKLFEPDSEILSWNEVNGEQTEAQSTELNRALMLASQNAASVVALNQLGCDVSREGTGAVVSAIEKTSPAARVLKVGDVIVEVDSKKVNLETDVVDAIGDHKPGDKIFLEIERGKDKKKMSVSTKLAESPFEKGKAFLGVALITRDQEFNFPIEINIDSGDVSGPSAGLAFTLSIIDQLTKGDLTGGKLVSVTGEIFLEGEVGPVGGIEQKAIVAQRSKSDFMLVPQGEGKVAREGAGSMEVFEVSNIDEALKVLEENGGDPLSQMQSCPTS